MNHCPKAEGWGKDNELVSVEISVLLCQFVLGSVTVLPNK